MGPPQVRSRHSRGSPVPLKGVTVIRVRLLEGKAVDSATEIFIRCKIASKGTSALDCESRHGLGFRPALDYHMLDTLGVRLPRCEGHSRTRKDRAYAFSSSLSAVEGTDCFEPGDADRWLLTVDGPEPLSLQPVDGVLIPVTREEGGLQDGSLCEAVLPVEGQVRYHPRSMGHWSCRRVHST